MLKSPNFPGSVSPSIKTDEVRWSFTRHGQVLSPMENILLPSRGLQSGQPLMSGQATCFCHFHNPYSQYCHCESWGLNSFVVGSKEAQAKDERLPVH